MKHLRIFHVLLTVFVALLLLLLFISSSDQNRVGQALYRPLEYTIFNDDFSYYPLGNCKMEGEWFGSWVNRYAGYGCVKIVGDNTNRYLYESPKASTAPGETHASLVLGPTFEAPYTLTVKMSTVKQLRTPTPNPWETAWVIWNYRSDKEFYYFTLKTNGWELGKEDPNYPGNQRFLATGSSTYAQPGRWYTVKVMQDINMITVYVDNVWVTTFYDSERPYNTGYIGLYNEDAQAYFDNVKVTTSNMKLALV